MRSLEIKARNCWSKGEKRSVGHLYLLDLRSCLRGSKIRKTVVAVRLTTSLHSLYVSESLNPLAECEKLTG